MSKLYSFCCEHGESWTSYCAQCRTESTKLRAQVADLKARLKAVRRPGSAYGPGGKWASVTDLRVRNWRKR